MNRSRKGISRRKFRSGEITSSDLDNDLKTAINSVYGLASVKKKNETKRLRDAEILRMKIYDTNIRMEEQSFYMMLRLSCMILIDEFYKRPSKLSIKKFINYSLEYYEMYKYLDISTDDIRDSCELYYDLKLTNTYNISNHPELICLGISVMVLKEHFWPKTYKKKLRHFVSEFMYRYNHLKDMLFDLDDVKEYLELNNVDCSRL